MISDADNRRYVVKARARRWAKIVRDENKVLPTLAEDDVYLREDEILTFRELCEDFGIVQRSDDLHWESAF